MDEIFSTLAEIEKEQQTAVLCVITETSGSTPRHTGSKMIVFSDGKTKGTVGGGETEYQVIQQAMSLLKTGGTEKLKYKLVNPEEGDPGICGGEIEVYLEAIGISDKLVVIGAGHVGIALVKLAKWLGFYVTLIDDREELSGPEDFGTIADRYIVIDLADLNKELPEDLSRTSFVLATRGYQIDLIILSQLLRQTPRYIGVIGSKRRWITAKKELKILGFDEKLIDAIYSPIGLDLKAETPEEIAVSIMAEILAQKNQATGKSLRV